MSLPELGEWIPRPLTSLHHPPDLGHFVGHLLSYVGQGQGR